MWHVCMAEVIAACRIGEENARYYLGEGDKRGFTCRCDPWLVIAIPGADIAPRRPPASCWKRGVRILTSVPIHTRRRDEFMAHVFVMPPPEHSVEAHFIGVVHRWDESALTVRYFTLERVADGSSPPRVCASGPRPVDMLGRPGVPRSDPACKRTANMDEH
jgi:hypothetical protein